MLYIKTILIKMKKLTLLIILVYIYLINIKYDFHLKKIQPFLLKYNIIIFYVYFIICNKKIYWHNIIIL
jgi:hypothetical protein